MIWLPGSSGLYLSLSLRLSYTVLSSGRFSFPWFWCSVNQYYCTCCCFVRSLEEGACPIYNVKGRMGNQNLGHPAVPEPWYQIARLSRTGHQGLVSEVRCFCYSGRFPCSGFSTGHLRGITRSHLTVWKTSWQCPGRVPCNRGWEVKGWALHFTKIHIEGLL